MEVKDKRKKKRKNRRKESKKQNQRRKLIGKNTHLAFYMGWRMKVLK
jgi:hypothetical protein